MGSPVSRAVWAFGVAVFLSGGLMVATDLPRARQALSAVGAGGTAADWPWLRDGARVYYESDPGRVWVVEHAPREVRQDWTVLIRCGEDTAFAAPWELRPVGVWR